MMWTVVTILFLVSSALGSRTVRYVAFDPPIIYPQVDHVTVSARSNYSMTCEGVYPVTWHLPQNGEYGISADVRNRVTTTYTTNPSSAKMYVSTLTVRHMVYTDTGSYICSFNGTKDFTSIDNSTRLHIYVYDESHLLTHPNDDFDFQQFVQYETAVIPCTPTHPNVTVTLIKQGSGPIKLDNQYITYSPKVGFLISPVMPDQHPGVYTCRAEYAGKTSEYYTQMTVLMRTSYVPPPHINRTSGSHVTVMETLALTCTITVDWGVMVRLSWQLPNKDAITPRLLLPEPVSRNVSLGGSHLKVVEQKILLHNVEKEDQGNYMCIVTDHSGNTKTRREYVRIYDRDQSFLRVWQDGFSTLHKTVGKAESVQWVIQIAAYPQPKITWFDPDGEVMLEGEDVTRGRTVQSVMGEKPRSMLKLKNLKLRDSGEYVVKVENDFHVKFENFSLVVTEKPKVSASVVEVTAGGLYQYGDQYTLRCTATGYPVPKIQWTFKKCRDYNKCEKRKEIKYRTTEAPYGKFQMDSSLVVVAKDSGRYSCVACGGDNCQMAPIDFFVTDVPDGFAIIGQNRVIQGDNVDLKCSASKYNFTEENVVWYKQTVRGLEEVRERKRKGRRQNNKESPKLQIISETTTKFTISKRLKFSNVSPQDSGVYVCRATLPGPKKRHNKELLILERTTELRVQGLEKPKIYQTNNMDGNVTLIMDKGQGIELQCKVRGVPTPKLTWFHEGNIVPLSGNPNIQFLDDGMSLRIGVVVEGRDEGLYKCLATSRAGKVELEQTVIKVEAPTIYQTNLLGNRETEKVMDTEARLTLQCQTNGKPQPTIIWTLGGIPINNDRANISNRNQTLVVDKFTREDEGRYECKASNRGGAASAFQWIKLSSSQQAASMYSSSIAVPVFIAVGAALVLAIILVAVAKICVSTGRWKAPPTPPTPRLTQFDLPEDEDQEAESCRLTLSRDGSPFIPGVCQGCQGCSGQCHQQQCQGCHYNMNGIYGCSGNMSPVNQHFGGNGSLVGVRPGNSPPPGSTCMSDYSQHTLPNNRMYTLRREGTLRKNKESRSASPRLSAEF